MNYPKKNQVKVLVKVVKNIALGLLVAVLPLQWLTIWWHHDSTSTIYAATTYCENQIIVYQERVRLLEIAGEVFQK